MLERVLVCLDGSPLAERVIGYVSADLGRCGGEVVLLRAVSQPAAGVSLNLPGTPGTPMVTSGAIEKAAAEQEQAARYLEGIADRIRAAGLTVETLVLPGPAGAAIVNYARLNSITLIVVASHGHGGLRRLTIGSTADYVLRNSAVPVLMVTAASP